LIVSLSPQQISQRSSKIFSLSSITDRGITQSRLNRIRSQPKRRTDFAVAAALTCDEHNRRICSALSSRHTWTRAVFGENHFRFVDARRKQRSRCDPSINNRVSTSRDAVQKSFMELEMERNARTSKVLLVLRSCPFETMRIDNRESKYDQTSNHEMVRQTID